MTQPHSAPGLRPGRSGRTVALRWFGTGTPMNNIIYIVGLIVVIVFILGALGLR